MPLGDHLRELRKRIMLAAAGIVAAAVGGWFLYTPLVRELQAPLEDVGVLNFTTVGQAFDLRIQVALFLGLFLASPWWIGQVWMFVAPGLTRMEKVYSLAFMFAGAALFVGGGALAWWVLPHAIEMLTSLTPENAQNFLEARMYFSFYMKVTVVFGIAFLLPELMVGLNFLGVVRGRVFLKAWRWAVIAAFAFTAIANPLPDVWSMIIMGGAISALYFLAVGVCFLRDRYTDRRKARVEAAAAAAGD
ncbi:twin-arginine translocase subunit TatC [Georgenia alba]|uniref:Sec-independent protein translocase protein TatC n=1 Tax=Georgenia alba TaxID=2233858 RepID=A0ABW2QGC2_9MICO